MYRKIVYLPVFHIEQYINHQSDIVFLTVIGMILLNVHLMGLVFELIYFL
jgi:hypothetical protein